MNREQHQIRTHLGLYYRDNNMSILEEMKTSALYDLCYDLNIRIQLPNCMSRRAFRNNERSRSLFIDLLTKAAKSAAETQEEYDALNETCEECNDPKCNKANQ